jgi:hypothetical protein
MNQRAIVPVLVLVAIAAVVPIFVWGIPVGGDLPNHFRFAMPFYDSIQHGHLYPGWLAESNAGYGDPRFRFYPPGLYYLLAAARAFGGWYTATLVSFAFLSIMGSLGTYFWARTTQSASTAMWAGIFYTFAPYHLNELYQASLLSEYAASAALPFVFAFIERICKRDRIEDVAGLAAAYALLVLTNLPLLVVGSISALIFALARLEKKNRVLTLGRLAAGVVVGLAASSFFWIRMISELSWIKGSSVAPNSYYDYHLNFLFSTTSLTNRNTWYANILGLATILFIFPAIILLRKHLRPTLWQIRGVVLVIVFSLIMTTPLSTPLWALIPKLAEVQFPWRWLAVTSLFGSFLTAVSLTEWRASLKTQLLPRNLVPWLGFALACIFVVTQVLLDSDFMNKQRFEEFLPTLRQGLSFKLFLPVNASEVGEVPRMESNVDAGERAATVKTWEPEYRVFDVAAGEHPQNVRVRTYYYPHWTAWSKATPLQISSDSNGVALINVPRDATTVEMKFLEPQRTGISEVASAIATLLIIPAFVVALVRRRSKVDG